MTYKHRLLIGATTVALAMPAMAANSITDGARALTKGAADTGRGILTGAADTGRGLLAAPKNLLNINDGSLPDLSQGVQEFGLSGNVNFADDIAYNVDLTYGYFFKDNWQVGFGLGVQGEDSDFNLGLGLFTEYNFVNQSKWVPFIGVSAEWVSLDSDAFDANSIGLGVDLGVKYFIRENLAISFSISAEYAFDDVFPGGDDFAQVINIGTRFYF